MTNKVSLALLLLFTFVWELRKLYFDDVQFDVLKENEQNRKSRLGKRLHRFIRQKMWNSTSTSYNTWLPLFLKKLISLLERLYANTYSRRDIQGFAAFENNK